MPPDEDSSDALKLRFIFVPQGEVPPDEVTHGHTDWIRLPGGFDLRTDDNGAAPASPADRTDEGGREAMLTSSPGMPFASARMPPPIGTGPVDDGGGGGLARLSDDPIAAYRRANEALAIADDGIPPTLAGATASRIAQIGTDKVSAPAAAGRAQGAVSPAVTNHPRTPVVRTATDRAGTIFGETSGLYPQSIDPAKSATDPTNWQTDSYDALQFARTAIGVVAGRNTRTHTATPKHDNPAERDAWQSSESAGNAAAANPALLDSHITQFYLRGDGDTGQPWPTLRRYLTVGPFRNVGGGDAPAGNNLFIEFYGAE
jgi:hypothetical protein